MKQEPICNLMWPDNHKKNKNYHSSPNRSAPKCLYCAPVSCGPNSRSSKKGPAPKRPMVPQINFLKQYLVNDHVVPPTSFLVASNLFRISPNLEGRWGTKTPKPAWCWSFDVGYMYVCTLSCPGNVNAIINTTLNLKFKRTWKPKMV